MKTKLILATCMTAAAMGAQAQSTVQLSGLADAYIGSIRMAGDATRKSVVGSGGMTTSWWGMSGSEDLGGGLKAHFALNGFFRMDTGETGRFTNDTQFSRDAYVGFSGPFGAVNLGRGKSPNFLPTIVFNPFGDSFTFSPLVLHANVPLGPFGARIWEGTTSSDTGWSNQITYSSPSFAGLKANIHYQFGEIATDTGKNNMGLNLMYSGGPLGLTAFWERNEVNNPVLNALPGGATRSNWMLGGSYDASVLKGFITYGKSSSDLAGAATKTTTSLGLSAPLGNGKVLAAWANTKIDAGNTRDTITVGYDHTLSKRTDVYAVLMNDKITTLVSGNSFGLGVRHRF